MTGEFCSRDGGFLPSSKLTLKVIILNVSVQPEDGGRQSGGSRRKFYGPHLCPWMPDMTAGKSGEGSPTMCPRGRGNGYVSIGQSVPQRLLSIPWLLSLLPPNLTSPGPSTPFQLPKREKGTEGRTEHWRKITCNL